MSSLYRTNINYGGWFSFNSTRKGWNPEYAERMLNHYFSTPLLRHTFGDYAITDEMLITNNINYSSISGKSVLVIGGGPSSKLLTEEKFNSYDYVFSCNHFYKNDFLFERKLNLVLVGDEVDLEDRRFTKYIQKFKPIVGFEHSTRSTYSILEFKKKHSNVFVYLTRYFSRLGYVSRAMVLAKLFGAKKIDFIGMDGFNNNTHYFEDDKSPPPFNDTVKFQEQMRVFCKYMFDDLG